MKEEKDLYWGLSKSVGVSKSGEKTQEGAELLVLHLDDRKTQTQLVPEKSFKAFATDKPIDHTQFRDKRNEIIAQDIVRLIMEYDIKSADIISLFNHVGTKMQNAFEHASNWLWTGDVKQWIPGFSFMDNRTLLEAERVLKQIPSNEGDKEPK